MNCKYINICGGCFYGHISYEQEIKIKEGRFSDILLENSLKEINFIPALKPYGYRNKMEFTFKENKLGLHERNNFNNVIDLDNCLLISDNANKIIQEIKSIIFSSGLSFYNTKTKEGLLKYFIIRETLNPSQIIAGFTISDKNNKEYDKLIKIISGYKNIKSFIIENNTVSSIANGNLVFVSENELNHNGIYETIKSKKYFYGINSFFQTNLYMYEMFVDVINQVIILDENKDILFDTFSGVGLFGMSFSEIFNEVYLIENSVEASFFAKKNIKYNNINNCYPIAGDTYKILRTKINEFMKVKKNTLFIFDPPRTGLQKIKKLLLKNDIKRFIYISCNPKVLKQDLEEIREKYKIVKATALDLFPRTEHFESVVLLEQKC